MTWTKLLYSQMMSELKSQHEMVLDVLIKGNYTDYIHFQHSTKLLNQFNTMKIKQVHKIIKRFSRKKTRASKRSQLQHLSGMYSCSQSTKPAFLGIKPVLTNFYICDRLLPWIGRKGKWPSDSVQNQSSKRKCVLCPRIKPTTPSWLTLQYSASGHLEKQN